MNVQNLGTFLQRRQYIYLKIDSGNSNLHLPLSTGPSVFLFLKMWIYAPGDDTALLK